MEKIENTTVNIEMTQDDFNLCATIYKCLGNKTVALQVAWIKDIYELGYKTGIDRQEKKVFDEKAKYEKLVKDFTNLQDENRKLRIDCKAQEEFANMVVENKDAEVRQIQEQYERLAQKYDDLLRMSKITEDREIEEAGNIEGMPAEIPDPAEMPAPSELPDPAEMPSAEEVKEADEALSLGVFSAEEMPSAEEQKEADKTPATDEEAFTVEPRKEFERDSLAARNNLVCEGLLRRLEQMRIFRSKENESK